MLSRNLSIAIALGIVALGCQTKKGKALNFLLEKRVLDVGIMAVAAESLVNKYVFGWEPPSKKTVNIDTLGVPLEKLDFPLPLS